MKFCIIGAGAMGSAYGGLLAKIGYDVAFIDSWREHVDALNARGMTLDGAKGEHHLRVSAHLAPPADLRADVAMIWTDTNNTRAAAKTAAALLAPDGFAITLQNGIGNVETLVDVLGAARVAAGSSMCSAAMRGIAHASLTHLGMTSLGELDGTKSKRIVALHEALTAAGFQVQIPVDIMSLIWTKFSLNCSINAICATTGLRLGEFARLEATDQFQDRVMDELFTVLRAKRITLTDPDLRATVKMHCRKKFSRPSMLQHIEAGKRTEIDALNGALVAEGRKLGLALPYNESLVMLLKGVEHKSRECRGRNETDYAELERRVQAG
jgi:2-dehydropantoate 2-reductase